MSTLPPAFIPPFSPLEQVVPILRQQGYAVLNPSAVEKLCEVTSDELSALTKSWSDLPADQYLKDGGRYRKRRHTCFVVEGDEVSIQPHRAHWQPLEYNALHGGMQRMFEPMNREVVNSPAWNKLIASMGRICSGAMNVDTWFVEAHQFRIDTTDGIGRPTPEGAHRDGVDFVAVILVGRDNVKGGETRIFDAQGPNGQRFTMVDPWTLILLDDARMIHETTPIQPLSESGGYRDTLVITFRSGNFQGEGVPASA